MRRTKHTLIRLLNYSSVTLFFLLLLSCASQEVAKTPYSISGTVYNYYNSGLPNIKVYYGDAAYATTNSQGQFSIETSGGPLSLQPQDPVYQFSPATIAVTQESSGLYFYGAPVVPETPNATAVYQWFSQMQLANGLLESSENSNSVSLYDNALAALVFTAKGDRLKAEKIFNFFSNKMASELDAGTGGFAQFRTAAGVPFGPRWMGDNCWLLIALNTYATTFNSTTYSTLQSHLASWIRSLQNPNGSLNAGYDANGLLNFQVTEGMIDAYNAVLGYDSFHSNLVAYLKQNRWSVSQKYMISYPNNYYQYALDNFSWAYSAFEDFPVPTLQSSVSLFGTTKTATATAISVTGFCFDIDKDTVWYEGTGQMVVAYQKAGLTTQVNYYLGEMEKGIVSSTLYPNAKGLPYASTMGTGYTDGLLWGGADTKPVVSSSAWYLFAQWHVDPMAVGYPKNAPQADKFWMN
jgi:hypothetical protein